MRVDISLVVFILFLSILFAIVIKAQGTLDHIYTPTTETHCSGGICTLTLYSGVRYVYDDGIWKRVEEAKSLKKAWVKAYLEKDKDFDIEVLEVNYTYLELNFTFDPSNYTIDELKLKYPECIDSKENDIKCDFKFDIKEDVCEFNETSEEEYCYKNQTKFQYKYQLKNGELKTDMKYVYKGNPLGKEFTFGGNSTTIQLQDADTENLEDRETELGGAATSFKMSNNLVYDTVIKFNLSTVPSGQTIDDAKFAMYVYGTTGYSCSYSLKNVTDQTWTEDNENPTIDGNVVDSISGIDRSTWAIFNVTNAVISDYNLNRVNTSFAPSLSTCSPTLSYTQPLSKEYTTDTTKRPYLNITYSEAVTTTTTSTTTTSTTSTTTTPAATTVHYNESFSQGITINSVKDARTKIMDSYTHAVTITSQYVTGTIFERAISTGATINSAISYGFTHTVSIVQSLGINSVWKVMNYLSHSISQAITLGNVQLSSVMIPNAIAQGVTVVSSFLAKAIFTPVITQSIGLNSVLKVTNYLSYSISQTIQLNSAWEIIKTSMDSFVQSVGINSVVESLTYFRDSITQSVTVTSSHLVRMLFNAAVSTGIEISNIFASVLKTLTYISQQLGISSSFSGVNIPAATTTISDEGPKGKLWRVETTTTIPLIEKITGEIVLIDEEGMLQEQGIVFWSCVGMVGFYAYKKREELKKKERERKKLKKFKKKYDRANKPRYEEVVVRRK